MIYPEGHKLCYIRSLAFRINNEGDLQQRVIFSIARQIQAAENQLREPVSLRARTQLFSGD
jgi:hypothetical protein